MAVAELIPSAMAGACPRGDVETLLGDSAPMRRLRAEIDAVARSEAQVLVTGESGTGKELVARRLHRRSARADRPFVAVNCAAFPEALVEAELFGCVRGAYTGAVRAREGRFQAAHTGVLFLDEVAELSLEAQAKLLRVLEEGTFEPLGTCRSRRVDVRVVSATHRDLRGRAGQGAFREDLYYRLKVVHVRVPPLRERLDDLPLLARWFLARFAPDRELTLSAEAWSLLRAHPWPGNVRELENALLHAAVVCPGERIQPEHLPLELRPLEASPSAAAGDAAAGDEPPASLSQAVQAFERDYLLRALQACNGARSRAAARLGISRKNLWEKLRRHGIELRPGQMG